MSELGDNGIRIRLKSDLESILNMVGISLGSSKWEAIWNQIGIDLESSWNWQEIRLESIEIRMESTQNQVGMD